MGVPDTCDQSSERVLQGLGPLRSRVGWRWAQPCFPGGSVGAAIVWDLECCGFQLVGLGKKVSASASKCIHSFIHSMNIKGAPPVAMNGAGEYELGL